MYIDRSAAPRIPCTKLCVNEKQYLAELDRLGIPYYLRGRWISEGANATTHTIERAAMNNSKIEDSVKRVHIVCINVPPNRTPLEICGLLVHEAVHVAQDYFSDIGERYPASEQMAYAIQYVSQKLMEAYVELAFKK